MAAMKRRVPRKVTRMEVTRNTRVQHWSLEISTDACSLKISCTCYMQEAINHTKILFHSRHQASMTRLRYSTQNLWYTSRSLALLLLPAAGGSPALLLLPLPPPRRGNREREQDQRGGDHHAQPEASTPPSPRPPPSSPAAPPPAFLSTSRLVPVRIAILAS